MKFKTERVDLDEDKFGVNEKDEPLWIVIPKGVKEGFAHEISGSEDGESAEQAVMRSNWRILSLVRSWNVDDSDGNTLPLPKDLAPEQFADDPLDLEHPEIPRLTAKQKYAAAVTRALSEVPIGLFEFIARRVVNRPGLSDRVQGF